MNCKWIVFPTGRWAATMNSHGGHLALHAWIGGEWAVTRGQTTLKAGEPFVIGSKTEGQPTGKDLHEAMELAEAAALEIMEGERIAHGKL